MIKKLKYNVMIFMEKIILLKEIYKKNKMVVIYRSIINGILIILNKIIWKVFFLDRMVKFKI